MSTATSPLPTARLAPPRAVLGLVVLTAVIVISTASSTLPSPFYPEWQRLLGLDTASVTAMFAVYPVTLLVVLLTTGSLSDHVGRRPILTAALIFLAVALALFALPPSLGVLILARALQGVAVGLSLTAAGAFLAELQPPGATRLVAVVNAAAPAVGLAVGALWAGGALDVTVRAPLFVFGAAGLVALLLAVALWFVPETSPRIIGALGSMTPRIRIAREARPAFVRVAPAIVAGWMTGGLFISLGSTVVRDVFHEPGHLVQALSVGVLAGTGAVAVVVMARAAAGIAFTTGTVALVVGTVAGLGAIALGSLPLYLAVLAITGWGFGTAYAGALRLLLPEVPAAAQAGLYAGVYVLAYLAFGVPALAAGIVAPVAGLPATVAAYGTLVLVFAAAALIAQRRRTAMPAPASSDG